MASLGPGEAPGRGATIRLAFKNPSRPLNDIFELDCSLDATVGQLKRTLQSQYPGNPAPEAITLIYAGKVLRDEASPLSAFLSADLSPVAIHIVVKAAAPGAAGSGTAPAMPSTSSPAPTPAPVPTRDPRTEPEAPLAGPPAVAPRDAPAPPPPAATAPSQGNTPMSTPPPQARPPAPAPAAASPAQSFAATPSPSSVAAIMAAQQSYTAAYQAAYQAALHSMMAAGGASPGPSPGNAAAPSPATMAAVMVPQPMFSVGFSSPMGAATPPQQQQGDGATPPPALAYQPAPAYHMPMPLPLQAMPYPVAVQPHAQQYYYAAPPPQGPVLQGHEQQRGGEPLQLRHRRRGRALTPDEVLRVARMLRQQGVALPPELAAALERHEGAVAGGRRGAPAAAPRPRAARVFQLRLQINVRALLQMAVLMVVVYQHCPPRRFAMLCALGLVLWLSTTPRVRAFLQAVTGFRPMAPGAAAAPAVAPQQPEAALGGEQQQQERQEGEGPAAADVARPAVAAGEPAGPEPAAAPAAAAPIDAAAAPGAVPQDPGQQPPRGILAEIHAFVAGFITSLLPAMDHNHDPAAVAAAAEEMRDVFAGQ